VCHVSGQPSPLEGLVPRGRLQDANRRPPDIHGIKMRMATKKRSARRRGPSQRSVLIGCRVQKPFLKDLDTYRKPLNLSRPAAFVKLATEHLAGLKEPAEKLWEGAVEQMFPVAGGVKGGD
jgi:hypothetical protein